MSTMIVRSKVDSEILHPPEMRSLDTSAVDTTSSEVIDTDASGDFYDTVGSIPADESQWSNRQSTFRTWRADSRFAAYWPMLDRLLTLDFAGTRVWAVAAEAICGLDSEAYDFEAWHDLRESSRLPLSDRAP